jgi:hypothetical protein
MGSRTRRYGSGSCRVRLDGDYRCGAGGVPTFVAPDAPADDELHALLQTIIARLIKRLRRRGVRVEGMGQTYLAEPDGDVVEARTLRPPGRSTRPQAAGTAVPPRHPAGAF